MTLGLVKTAVFALLVLIVTEKKNPTLIRLSNGS